MPILDEKETRKEPKKTTTDLKLKEFHHMYDSLFFIVSFNRLYAKLNDHLVSQYESSPQRLSALTDTHLPSCMPSL